MKVLIIDDSIEFSNAVVGIVNSISSDIEAVAINVPEESVKYMKSNHSDVGLIFLDIEFGIGARMNGLDLLEIFRKNYVQIPVIMLSGKGTIDTAVKATKLGAVNFIEKSTVGRETIRGAVNSTINLSKTTIGEDSEILNFLNEQGIIGSSKKLIDVGRRIIDIGRTDSNVIITGETGTGKALAARALHNIGNRKNNKFVTVDVSSLSGENFQRELFGYVKNAFEGADSNSKGAFGEANKGVLFLDKIEYMPKDLQLKLLQPLEEKRIKHVGANDYESVNIRFISSSSKNLNLMIQRDEFDGLLYHRLCEADIFIPPLRERKEDIIDIIVHTVNLYNLNFEKNKFFTQDAMNLLSEQEWLGNVRELVNAVKLMLQTVKKEQIDAVDVVQYISNKNSTLQFNDVVGISSDRTLKEDKDSFYKIKIEQALQQYNGNVSKTASNLGVSRETLHNKIKAFNINVDKFRKHRS